MGRRGYQRFWAARVARQVLGLRGKSSLTVEELAQKCWMLVEDVAGTLKIMGVCEIRKKSDGVGIAKTRIKEWVEREGIDLRDPIDMEAFTEPWSQGVEE
jgi:hypothetical protein